MKRKLTASNVWTVTANVFNTVSTMVVFIALARLLTPAQFGIVAFASVFIEFSRILVGAGIPDALIQRPDWDRDVSSTAFWTNIVIGVSIPRSCVSSSRCLRASITTRRSAMCSRRCPRCC